MRLEELLKRMFIYYFFVFTGTMFSACIYCSIFYPDTCMSLRSLKGMMLLALSGTLPLIVFYSKHELTKKQYRVRVVVHIVLLETVLLLGLRKFGAYSKVYEGAVLAGLIFGVYLVIRLISFMLDVKTADTINERLKEMNSEE